MKDIQTYFDSYDLIRNGDTGDSCRETGTYAMITGEERGLSKCYTPQGFVRHPNPTDDWHKDVNQFSRDQWAGMMAYLVVHPNQDLLSKNWALQKLFRAQNNDIISYEYVMYMRAYRMWYLYPIMTILDIGLMINVLIRAFKSYYDPNDTADDINVVMQCIAFKRVYPTITGFLARKLYRLYKGGLEGVYGAWERYYARPEAPPMDLLYKQAIKEL